MTKVNIKYFTTKEWLIIICSFLAIITSYLIFDRNNYLTLIASLIGAFAIMLHAKGNPFGQILMVAFSIIYAIISYSYSYYGEMITYLGMTLPMAVFSFIVWLKNPYKGKKTQVKIARFTKEMAISLTIFAILTTVAFYFILRHFNTNNLVISTISITTSFSAAFLTFRRSSYYALFYCLNDIVLIVMWILASIYNTSYICVVVCFFVFLFNDAYGFINWKKMELKQALNL